MTQEIKSLRIFHFECSKYEVRSGNEIRLYEKIDEPDIVSEMLIERGIKLFSMYQMGFNLEDYFINLIGGNKNA